jgi:hypothetical protein
MLYGENFGGKEIPNTRNGKWLISIFHCGYQQVLVPYLTCCAAAAAGRTIP